MLRTPRFAFFCLEVCQTFLLGSHSNSSCCVVQNFGLSGKFPAAVYADENLKYPYDQKPFDTAAVSQFVSDVLAGKVEPFYRSEPIPEKNDAPVKVIVGKTFKPMVEESDDDVLIMFYAPCTFCSFCLFAFCFFFPPLAPTGKVMTLV